MEQRVLEELTVGSVRQQIPRLTRKPEVHCRVPKSLQRNSIQSPTNPLHIVTPCFCKTHFNILPICLGLECDSPLVKASWPNFWAHFSSLHAFYMPRPANPPWFYHPNCIWRRIHITQFLIMQLSLLGQNISTALFSQTQPIYVLP